MEAALFNRETSLHKLVKMMQLINDLYLRIKKQLQNDYFMNQINCWKFDPMFIKKENTNQGLSQAP